MTKLTVKVNGQFENFSLAIEQTFTLAGITGIYGHSGSGKSTLLRIIAGLNRQATGHIYLADTPLLDTAKNCFINAEQRQLSMVFQDSRLFPHLTVRENLNYAVKRRKNKHLVFDEIIALTELNRLIDMPVVKLSGGEQQRVALARALLNEPKLLLLDEPLSALDHASKNSLLKLITKVQKTLSIPILYVSHSMTELQQVADNLLVLAQGKVKNYGNIHQIIHQLNHTATDNNVTDLENSNFDVINQQTSLSLPIKSVDSQHQLITLALGKYQEIHLPYNDFFADKLQLLTNDNSTTDLRCFIFATDISICKTEPVDSSIVNNIHGRITLIESHHTQVLITAECEQQEFFVRISSYSLNKLALAIDTPVYLQFKANAVRTYLL